MFVYVKYDFLFIHCCPRICCVSALCPPFFFSNWKRCDHHKISHLFSFPERVTFCTQLLTHCVVVTLTVPPQNIVIRKTKEQEIPFCTDILRAVVPFSRTVIRGWRSARMINQTTNNVLLRNGSFLQTHFALPSADRSEN